MKIDQERLGPMEIFTIHKEEKRPLLYISKQGSEGYSNI